MFALRFADDFDTLDASLFALRTELNKLVLPGSAGFKRFERHQGMGPAKRFSQLRTRSSGAHSHAVGRRRDRGHKAQGPKDLSAAVLRAEIESIQNRLAQIGEAAGFVLFREAIQ